MRKIKAFLTAFVLVAALAACGKDDNEPVDTGTVAIMILKRLSLKTQTIMKVRRMIAAMWMSTLLMNMVMPHLPTRVSAIR